MKTTTKQWLTICACCKKVVVGSQTVRNVDKGTEETTVYHQCLECGRIKGVRK